MKKINYFRFFTIIIFMIYSKLIFSETINTDILEAKLQELISIDISNRKDVLEKLDKEMAENLLSYISYKYTRENKELEIVFAIYDHLASIKATYLSQLRLNRLLLVIFITLLIFSLYLTYILIRQNQIIKELTEKQIIKQDEFK